jgi:Uma2 family endonuclease
MPNNSANHGNKTARITISVGHFIEENDLGECFAAETRFTIEEDPDTTLSPDFAFISKERLNDIHSNGYLRLAPDLVIETHSPNDTRTEFALKISRWLQAGVREVWALDPAARSVVVHRSGALPRTLNVDDTLTGSDVVPSYSIPVGGIYRGVHS